MGNAQKSTRKWTYFCSTPQNVDSLLYLARTTNPSTWNLVQSFDVTLQDYLLGLVTFDDLEGTTAAIRAAATVSNLNDRSVAEGGNKYSALRQWDSIVQKSSKDNQLPPFIVTEVTVNLYDSLGDPSALELGNNTTLIGMNRDEENEDEHSSIKQKEIQKKETTICCYQDNFFVQAVTELNLPALFALFKLPFCWGKTKILAFIYPEIIFGCPSYTLIFALPVPNNDSSTTTTAITTPHADSNTDPDLDSDSSPLPPLHSSFPLKSSVLTTILFSLPQPDVISMLSVNHTWRQWILKNSKLWKKIHDETWKFPPVPILTDTVGWYVTTLLKMKREKQIHKGLCATFNEFEFDISVLYKELTSTTASTIVLCEKVFNSSLAVLSESEVKEMTEILCRHKFTTVLSTPQKLFLNNIKFYFECCSKSKQPMFIVNRGGD